MNYNVNLTADGSVQAVATGTFNFLRVLSDTAAFQISFDGNTWKDAAKNNYFKQTASRVYFRTVNGAASAVVFACDAKEIQAQDTAQSNSPTNAVGNLGIANGTAAGNGNPQCDNNSYLYITNAMALNVPGVNAAGNRRQIIIFSVPTTSPAPLQVLDANGNGFMTIPAGTVIPLVTDATFILSGAGGVAYCTIGQMYLAQQG